MKKPKLSRKPTPPTETATESPAEASPAPVDVVPVAPPVTTTDSAAGGAVDVVSAIQPALAGDPEAQVVLKKAAEETFPSGTFAGEKGGGKAAEPARRGGASWFIPPQKPSQFGVK